MWLHLTSTWFFPRFVRKKKGRKLSDFRKGRETLQVSSLWLGLRGLVAASSAPQRHALPPLPPPHVSRRPADSEAGGPLAAPDRQGSGTPSLSICQSLSSKTSHDTQTSARPCCALMPFKWPIPLPESDNSQAKSRFILCVCVCTNRTTSELPRYGEYFWRGWPQVTLVCKAKSFGSLKY